MYTNLNTNQTGLFISWVKWATLFLFLFLGILALNNPVLAAGSPSALIPSPDVTNLGQFQVITDQQPEIRGIVLNFHQVEIYLDDQLVGVVMPVTGANGWGEFYLKLADNLSLGEHVLYTIAKNPDGFRSLNSPSIQFRVEQPYPAPTLYQPNQANTKGFSGIAWNHSILTIYLNGAFFESKEIEKNNDLLAVSFNYIFNYRLKPGYNLIWATTEDKTTHKVSKISNQITLFVPGSSQANLSQESSNFIPPVPAPTIITPFNNQVTSNPKPIMNGLVKNEHLVKIFIDNQEEFNFTPLPDSSGTTHFSYNLLGELSPGLHTIYMTATNLRGQESGRSNIVKFLVVEKLLPTTHYQQLTNNTPRVTDNSPSTASIELPTDSQESTEPKIDEGISVVAEPHQGDVKVENQGGDKNTDVKVVEDQEQTKVSVESTNQISDNPATDLERTETDQDYKTVNTQDVSDDWVNIGFIVVGIILVILIIWWVILERKEVEENANDSKDSTNEPKPPVPPGADELQ